MTVLGFALFFEHKQLLISFQLKIRFCGCYEKKKSLSKENIFQAHLKDKVYIALQVLEEPKPKNRQT